MCLPTSPRRFSVLVVDDNRDAADTLAVFLRLNGHDVRVAYDGEQAVAISNDWRPDAAVLDIVMQGVDGIELAARLRKVATWPLLLLAVTGVGTNDEVARVKAGVFDHFFLKPVDPEEVLRALDTHKID